MAKTKSKSAPIDCLKLDYSLAELPSSQHRAGLAGLVCIMRWLERQPAFKEQTEDGTLCKLTELDDFSASIELNQAGVEALFNEIYAASTEEQERPQPLKNKQKKIIPPLREEEREVTDQKGKTKTKKVYIYPVVVPAGSFLADPTYDKSVEGKNGIWIKLWRDMVWSILRGVPATRKPFEARAEGSYGDDAASVWKQLTQPEDYTVDLPSTYFLGAQSSNAENVPFKDRARFQFLLHFWLFAAQIYVPAVVDNEGKRNFVGYALAIPDVARLEWFCDELPDILGDRSTEKAGYRPRDAVVDLAVASALDMMNRLRNRLKQTTGEKLAEDLVFGIDVVHTEKQGNNIRVLSSTRLNPEESMLDQYAQIRDGFWSPLFRRQCLLNLVNHSPWYLGFGSLLCTLPYELSIENDYFRRDVREKFKALSDEDKSMSEAAEQTLPKSIETLIFQLVRTYVSSKLERKYQLKWSDVKGKNAEEKDYQEKKEKIAKDAFLAIRSRTEPMDFINYFVSSLCSVPQHMKTEAYVELTQALYQDTDKIRTLTLLALSANG